MVATGKDLARGALEEAQAVIGQFDLVALQKLNPTLHAAVSHLRDSIAAALAAPAYHVPGPYEIALALGASLAASGNYNTPGAAMTAAWFAVPEFYAGRDAYLREMVPILYPSSPPEGGTDGETS